MASEKARSAEDHVKAALRLLFAVEGYSTVRRELRRALKGLVEKRGGRYLHEGATRDDL